MSVLLRLVAAAAEDSSVAFDNLLFGNKHNMTSFHRLVITVIKNVSVFVFVCERTWVCVCMCQNVSIRNYKSVCVVVRWRRRSPAVTTSVNNSEASSAAADFGLVEASHLQTTKQTTSNGLCSDKLKLMPVVRRWCLLKIASHLPLKCVVSVMIRISPAKTSTHAKVKKK